MTTTTNVFGGHEAIANLAVRDIDVARKFYEETLGLELVHIEAGELLVFKSGSSTLHVYRSDFAGTNKATAVNWIVDDVEDVVRTLRAKGVEFEHYEFPNMTLRGDIHFGGDMKLAWFKDPDGNILGIASR
jgi:catechol 2,3-dioxygenase-like lactoylglutathione lyase family enzyme